MKIRFLDLAADDIMEVWCDDIPEGKELLKSIYGTVFQYYKEGFSGRIGIEIISDTGEVIHELRASQTYLFYDLFHAHPAAVRFWFGSQCIRRMGLF